MIPMHVFSPTIRAIPWLAIALLSLPVVGGLAGVLAPALGWLPALGGDELTLAHWQTLVTTPGLGDMVRLSLTTGLVSTLISLAIVMLFIGAFAETRALALVRRLLSPLLAVPHAAAAIGIAFLLTPSGLASRLVSPWPSGWEAPPDYLFPGDPWGLGLIIGLVIKEVPFLLLMSLAALPQCQAQARLRLARSLGYAPLTAFAKAVLPGLYPLIRLPVYAVIAFASANVEVAMILGPSTPPPLAVSVVRWINDPDLAMRFVASAAALLQLGVTLAALGAWWLGERLIARLCHTALTSGRRHTGDGLWAGAGAFTTLLAVALLGGSLMGLVLWSLAGWWPFPALLPSPLSLHTWQGALPGLLDPLTQTALIGICATGLSLALAIGALEAEQLRGRGMATWAELVLYLPLVVPPVAFLFGLVQLQGQAGLAPGALAVTLAHSLFVLPYVFLSLAESYRRLDPRWAQVAASLGHSSASLFLRVRLPLLTVPILTAAAVGFAVSVGQYLPTLLMSAGRLTTLTTEAVSLASGGDRRLAAVYALMQLLLPALGFALALILPRLLMRHRSGVLDP